MTGSHYMIDETEYAYCRETNKKDKTKVSVIEVFKHNCTNKNIKNVFCQVDKDSTGKDSMGVTTYGIETKDTDMLTITVYENNYEACKEDMMILNNAVRNAESRKNRKNQIIRRVAGVSIVIVGSLAALANCSLQKNKKETQELQPEPQIETTVNEVPLEDKSITPELTQDIVQQGIDNALPNMEQIRDISTMENVIPIEQYYEEQGIENPNVKTY